MDAFWYGVRTVASGSHSTGTTNAGEEARRLPAYSTP